MDEKEEEEEAMKEHRWTGRLLIKEPEGLIRNYELFVKFYFGERFSKYQLWPGLGPWAFTYASNPVRVSDRFHAFIR